MTKYVIFGTKENSEIISYYINNDTLDTVEAFTVDGSHASVTEFCGKPVIPYEEILTCYKRNDVKFLAPLGPTGMNKKRQEIYDRIKSDGFSFGSYVSSKATVLTKQIGDNTFILENNVIQPFTKIGCNVILWSGNHVGHHSVIFDHVMLTSHVVLSGRCTIQSYSYLGVNSTVKDGLTLAEGTYLTMGSNLTVNTDPWSVYRGEISAKTKIPSTKMKL